MRRVRFGVRVASRAGENGIVRFVRVAVHTITPSALVRPGVNGEMLKVVRQKLGGHPAHIRRVATGTVGHKIGRNVVGAEGIFKIRLVAGKTIGRRVRKITRRVAARTINNVVPFFQREKTMVNHLRPPIGIVEAVAFEAVGREPGILVVGVRRGHELVEVARGTVVADAAKLEGSLSPVALGTVRHGMCPDEWEAIVPVDLLNIIHEPVFGRVAPGTVTARRHLVHVHVARDALGICFRKNERFVAGPAVHVGVLPGECKTRLVVVESGSVRRQWHARHFGDLWLVQFDIFPMLPRNFPPLGRVASGAVHLEIFAVRILGEQNYGQPQK